MSEEEKLSWTDKIEPILAAILVVMIVGFVVFTVIYLLSLIIIDTHEQSKIDKDCLEKVAIKECSDRGGSLDIILSRFGGTTFLCYPEPRSRDSIEYKFLDEEKEGCRK